jgi:hypothetical protein
LDQTTYFIDRKKKLEEDIKRVEKKLSSMPAETLVYHKQVKNDKTYVTYFKQSFINGERIRTLLPKKKSIREAKLLAQKMYLSRALSDKKNELKCIDFYLKHRKAENFSDMLGTDSPYRDLLVTQSTIADDWEYAPYEKSTDHPENLTHPAPKGEMVRSKSEADIAQALFSHNIPYRYEEIHDIYGSRIATDFTILHPKTHEIILWEHFGRCDDPGYQSTIDYKMYRYIRAGYLPGRTMITTYEDSKHPFVFLDAEEIVQKYFL